jgi:hypothetical protein
MTNSKVVIGQWGPSPPLWLSLTAGGQRTSLALEAAKWRCLGAAGAGNQGKRCQNFWARDKKVYE